MVRAHRRIGGSAGRALRRHAAAAGRLMLRNYRPVGSNAGRPPIDDGPIARGALFAERFEGRDRIEVRHAAAKLLQDKRKADAAAAQASGAARTRKQPIADEAARRRVKDVVAAELQRALADACAIGGSLLNI